MNKIIGIDAGCTKMLMTAKWDGKYIDKTVPTGLEVTPEYLKDEIFAFIDSLPFVPEAIGMGVVGLVEDNTLKISHLRHLCGMKAAYFNTENYKAYFINDVKAAMVYEEQFYKEDITFALIMAGSGFAMSVRTEGVNVLGQNGWAGELGSNPYPINGGVEGLNEISGGNGILNKAGCGIGELLTALDNNEKFAIDVIEQAGFYFGLALSDVIHTFNPEYIVVGGSTATFKGYMDKAIAVAKQYTLTAMFNNCKIVTPRDAKRIVALGAIKFAQIQAASLSNGKCHETTSVKN
ncbi:ROK family protein [Bacillus sp. FSL K6-3431]|uniref:ROK family protein n=1 Tax=Bacillus sp. FSL K6-3431 TaxID=2921500 RepID=UPI0030FB45EC